MSNADNSTAGVKNISITGVAAQDFQKTKGTRRRRGKKYGGGNEDHSDSSVTLLSVGKSVGGSAMQPIHTTTSTITPTSTSTSTSTSTPTHTQFIQKNNLPPDPSTVQQPQQGGIQTKLVLNPPKRRETRLLLKGPKTFQQQQQQHQEKPTRKNVRKITLGLRGLTVKINRAKRLHKKVGDMKKDDVRKLLIEKGILKAGKKDPPEALMRQMYSDYLILTSKGL